MGQGYKHLCCFSLEFVNRIIPTQSPRTSLFWSFWPNHSLHSVSIFPLPRVLSRDFFVHVFISFIFGMWLNKWMREGRKLGGGRPSLSRCLFFNLTPVRPQRSAICLLKTSLLHHQPPPSAPICLSLLMLIKHNNTFMLRSHSPTSWSIYRKCTLAQQSSCV